MDERALLIDNKYYILIYENNKFKDNLPNFSEKLKDIPKDILENIELIISPLKSIILYRDNKFKKINDINTYNNTDKDFIKKIDMSFNVHSDGTFKIIFKKNTDVYIIIDSIKRLFDQDINYSNIMNSIDFYIKEYGLFKVIT